MVNRMNFDVERNERVRKIEEIIQAYLPEQEGYQKIVMEAMDYSILA